MLERFRMRDGWRRTRDERMKILKLLSRVFWKISIFKYNSKVWCEIYVLSVSHDGLVGVSSGELMMECNKICAGITIMHSLVVLFLTYFFLLIPFKFPIFKIQFQSIIHIIQRKELWIRGGKFSLRHTWVSTTQRITQEVHQDQVWVVVDNYVLLDVEHVFHLIAACWTTTFPRRLVHFFWPRFFEPL